jgi:NTP pyrophosphatase (non-canonical NTP hydrolase)
MLTFQEFAKTNRARCESPEGFNHALSSWSLSDWITATIGELGEAANVAKKLNRVRDGIPGNSETPEQLRVNLADEIADTFIYLDLLAQSQGIDLAEAVTTKFNRTSEKVGSLVRIMNGRGCYGHFREVIKTDSPIGHHGSYRGDSVHCSWCHGETPCCEEPPFTIICDGCRRYVRILETATEQQPIATG